MFLIRAGQQFFKKNNFNYEINLPSYGYDENNFPAHGFPRKIRLVFTVFFAFALALPPTLPSPMSWVGCLPGLWLLFLQSASHRANPKLINP
jgi:hypothetical protein